jgi:Rax2 C-terminal beta propeller domain/Bacterial Ig domain
MIERAKALPPMTIRARVSRCPRRAAWLRVSAMLGFVSVAALGTKADAAVGGSPFYEFKVVAKVGTSIGSGWTISEACPPDAPSGAAYVPAIGDEVAINNKGLIAIPAKIYNPNARPGESDPEASSGVTLVADPASDVPLVLYRTEDSLLVHDACSGFRSLSTQINNDDGILDAGGFVVSWDPASGLANVDCTPFPFDVILTTNGVAVPWCYDLVNGVRAIFYPSRADDGTVAFTGHRGSGGTEGPWGLFRSVGGIPSLIATATTYASGPFGYSSLQAPMVADGGTIVVHDGFDYEGEIWLYQSDGTPQLLTSTGSYPLAAAGRYPGISSDGKASVFLFQDDHGVEGLWLYINDSRYNRVNDKHKLLDVNTPIAYGPRLSDSAPSGPAITFDAFDFDSRTSVIHYDAGNDGDLDGDSLVIAFVAKPSDASVGNPANGNQPLLFSTNWGVWTLRVDLQNGLRDTNHTYANVSTILPVIQEGAQIDGATVTNFFLWNSLGKGTRAVDGSPRHTIDGTNAAPGDHVLAFRVETTAGPMVLFAAKLDSDGDGLPDHWERPGGGIDMDGDDEVDLPLADFGATPDHKDLFLEVNWLPQNYVNYWANEPHPKSLPSLAKMFALAPARNPDNTNGIRLHIDAGPDENSDGYPYSLNMGHAAALNHLEGGLMSAMTDDERPDVVNIGDFLDPTLLSTLAPNLKVTHFQTLKERFFLNNLVDKGAREFAFRYCILADFFEARLGITTAGAIQSLVVGRAQGDTFECDQDLDPDADGVPNVVIGRGDVIRMVTGTTAGRLALITGFTRTPGPQGFAVKITPAFNAGSHPQPLDRFIILAGNTGVSEVEFANTRAPVLGPDLSLPVSNNHGFAGNDLLVTLGGYGALAYGALDTMIRGIDEEGRLANAAVLWRTLAHELGHTLGLNHGGDAPDCAYDGLHHLSLMSYSHMSRLSATQCLRIGDCGDYDPPDCVMPDPGFASQSPVPGVVMSFSDGLDTVGFNEWANIRMAPYECLWFLGNTYGRHLGAPQLADSTTHVNWLDSLPFGLSGPLVTFLAPSPATAVPSGGPLTVRVSAESVSPIVAVNIRFDTDGDGNTDGAGETVTATDLGGGIYETAFATVSGPSGTREVRVDAEDALGNLTIVRANIMVGGSVSDTLVPEVSLLKPYVLQGLPPVQLSNWLQIEVEAKDYDFGTFQYIPAGSVMMSFDINGDGTTNGPGETVMATLTASNRFSAWFPDISGSTGIRYLYVRAVDKWLNVVTRSFGMNVILPDAVPPVLAFISPEEGATVALHRNQEVKVSASDNQGLQDVKIQFDANGDGTAEVFSAYSNSDGTYTASLYGISGPPGPRTISAVARDTALNETIITRSVDVAVVDLMPPTAYLISPPDGAYVSTNTTFLVSFAGTDDDSVAAMTVSFDIDGDGQTTGPGETVAFSGLSTSYYSGTAAFENVRGGFGPRTITVAATDASGKTNTAQRTVNVSSPLMISSPKPGDRVFTATTLAVQLTAATAVDPASLLVRFDTNGDGDTSDPGEAVHPVPAVTPSTWTASFSNIDGPPGQRQVFVDGRLTGGATQTVSVPIEVLDNGATPVKWVSLNPEMPGTEGPVYALIADGRGNVYAGGAFTVAGSVKANHVAKWDGSSWSALDVGLPDAKWVFALAFDGTNLYAGGDFGVAKWDGATWSLVGTLNPGPVRALAVSGTNLYAGGDFTSIGKVSTTGVAKWDGSAWSALGSGLNNYVNALAMRGSNLCVGGKFTTAGGTAASYIAEWDGTAWSPLGSGMNGPVYALAASDTNLYAAGVFNTAGGLSANSVAKWDGSAWSALGSGVLTTSDVYALAVHGPNLYAAGVFNTAGGLPANSVAKWDGSAWSALGSGISSASGSATTVYALATIGTDLYAGGDFRTTGALGAKYITKWNGSAWSALGSGMDSTVLALTVSGTDLYVGGTFNTVRGVSASRIAKWDGSSWSALGSGLSGMSSALSGSARVLALAASGTNLYVGGSFSLAGEVPATNIAKWNGIAWSALGSGVDSTVRALAVSGTNLYAGGDFSKAGGATVNGIASWNGSTWSPVGGGFPGTVLALAVLDTNLYAGGNFGFVVDQGTTVNSIAKWDGSAWSALGSGIGYGSVLALAVSGTDLYVAGHFYVAGGGPGDNIAKWDGSAWSALGSGMEADVNALAVSGTNLYAGGRFSSAGGAAVNRIAKWNGSAWSPLGSGILGNSRGDFDGSSEHNVYTLAADFSGHLFVGGIFGFAGTNLSPYIVEADIGGSVSCACALSATYDAGNVTISWPCASNGCILEAAEELRYPPSATVWTPVTPQPTGGRYTDPLIGARRFFRLRAP